VKNIGCRNLNAALKKNHNIFFIFVKLGMLLNLNFVTPGYDPEEKKLLITHDMTIENFCEIVFFFVLSISYS
jgi:hypothetical protein